eukprot:3525631-Prymnesium_polylepis.1
MCLPAEPRRWRGGWAPSGRVRRVHSDGRCGGRVHLLVVEHDPAHAPRVAQRAREPRVERQRVGAEQVGLVKDHRDRVLPKVERLLELEAERGGVVSLKPALRARRWVVLDPRESRACAALHDALAQ